MSARLEKEAVTKLVDLWMCINKINTCLLSVCSLKEIGKMKSFKFRMYCYSSCEIAQVCWTPFLYPICFFFSLINLVCYFSLFLLLLFFSLFPLSHIFSYQFMDSSIFFSRAAQWFLCINHKLSYRTYLYTQINHATVQHKQFCKFLTCVFISRNISRFVHCLILNTNGAMFFVVIRSVFGKHSIWGGLSHPTHVNITLLWCLV